ncbi:hypothetical protein JMJ77_0002995, partial [Colletotrichum scovillei]
MGFGRSLKCLVFEAGWIAQPMWALWASDST